MIFVKRFASFDDIQTTWEALENKTIQYPFQSFWYQKLFADSFCTFENIYLLGVYENNTLLAIGGFEKIENSIRFLGMKQILGGQDVTDYGDLLFFPNLSEEDVQQIWRTLIDYFAKQNSNRLELDFVREDSKTYQSFKTDSSIHIKKQEVAPYIVVPSDWEAYLRMLSGKERHELQRKIRRLESQNAFHFCSHETIASDFETFIELHRLSDPHKKKFMSEEMKQFFWKSVSVDKEDYRVDFCFFEIDHKQVASVMSFIGKGRVLAYNSGFDPGYTYYSVGFLLHAYLIKKSIKEKLVVHDFLRGNERYKYDLGAKDMQLYRLVKILYPYD